MALKRDSVNCIKRSWKNYSVNILINELTNGLKKCSNLDLNVQTQWNVLEGVIISTVDKLVPLCNFRRKLVNKAVPPAIKAKINKRKRLLNIDKRMVLGNCRGVKFSFTVLR